MIVNILYPCGKLKEIKISSETWAKLHQHRHFNKYSRKVEKKDYPYKKEWDIFLKKYKLRSTVFNLNCLTELNGVILTEAQIKKLP